MPRNPELRFPGLREFPGGIIVAAMKRLGRYEILDEIGRGGMAIVYRATDTALGRTVAIKTIRLAEQGTPEEAVTLRDRLMREAQAAATLSHPNVVAVYDVGQEGDITYVVMEYVHGMTLDRALQQPDAPRSPEAKLKIVEEVARALDYAHAHGVVHRDVKPGNIFVEKGGGVKLGDFGVAKITWGRTMTEAGTLMGSPHYMAPEQLKGERVTGRTDQYALAVVTYSMLVGHKPFDADTLASLASKILFEEAPSPAAFGVQLPPEAERVLHKGMSKSPSDRFVNCSEFAGALKDAFGRTGSAPRPEPARPPKSSSRRWMAVAGVVVLAAVLAGAALWFWPRHKYTESKKETSAKAVETKGSVGISLPKAVETPKVTAPKPLVTGSMRALGQRVNPKDGLTYINVPPGTFRMGCSPGDKLCDDDESPVRSVVIREGFWIGQTEVPVEAYQRFAKAAGREMPPPPGVGSYWREPKQPMNNVSWEEAGAYCEWAGGRLPAEAEWEYAARAGHPGPAYGNPNQIGWYSGERGSGNSGYKPHPIGRKAPNALGLFDMLGNVQEWCRESPYKYDQTAAAPPGAPAGSDHIMRGGSFSSSLKGFRVSFRATGSSRSGDYGFRCVLPLR